MICQLSIHESGIYLILQAALGGVNRGISLQIDHMAACRDRKKALMYKVVTAPERTHVFFSFQEFIEQFIHLHFFYL